MFGGIREHEIATAYNAPLSYIQTERKSSGSFLGIQGKRVIKFKANSFSGDIIDLAPNHEFKELAAILQMDNFTLVVDRGLQCIVQIDSHGNTTRTHSGTCAVTVGRTADGSFQEAKYKNPFDLASQNKDQTHLYVTNDGLLRLIDQENETVTTLYRAEWLLGRI